MPVSPAFTETAPRPRRKGELTAERILDAAEDLFAEHGYAGTTLRDVADRAGLRIPSLYNHFPSKDSLYAAVLERGIGPVFAMLTGFVERGGTADSALLIEQVMKILARRPSLPRLVLHETLTGGQRLTPLLREWIAPTFAKAREVVEANPGAARWRAEQIPLIVLALYHVVVGYFAIAPFYRELEGEDLLSERTLASQTQLVGALVDSLLAGDAESGSGSSR